jgi:hypothetical protein
MRSSSSLLRLSLTRSRLFFRDIASIHNLKHHPVDDRVRVVNILSLGDGTAANTTNAEGHLLKHLRYSVHCPCTPQLAWYNAAPLPKIRERNGTGENQVSAIHYRYIDSSPSTRGKFLFDAA